MRGVGGRRGNEFVDLFAQLVVQRRAVCALGERDHVGCASGGADDVRNLVPDKFAHAIHLPRNNVVVPFYLPGLTSRLGHGW